MASLFSQGTNECCVQLLEHADHIQINIIMKRSHQRLVIVENINIFSWNLTTQGKPKILVN